MDISDLGGNLIPLIILAVVVIVNIFFRRRRGERTQLEIIARLLSEVNYNQKLMETFNLHWQAKKFKTDSWNRNKAKLDFLDQSLQIALSDAFNIAEDFNQEIAAAKKHKSSSYLASISMDRLRTPLAATKQGLEEWLQQNMGRAMPQRRRGLFG